MPPIIDEERQSENKKRVEGRILQHVFYYCMIAFIKACIKMAMIQRRPKYLSVLEQYIMPRIIFLGDLPLLQRQELMQLMAQRAERSGNNMSAF